MAIYNNINTLNCFKIMNNLSKYKFISYIEYNDNIYLTTSKVRLLGPYAYEYAYLWGYNSIHISRRVCMYRIKSYNKWI